MNKSEINMKPCYVMLEPCTPKAQLALSVELRKVISERNIMTSRSKKKLITALDELDKSSEEETKRTTRKMQAVQEIFVSEEVYLKKLETIMKYFMQPIRRKRMLTDVQYELLFGSIETLYKVNGELLNALKKNLMNVAPAFLTLAPFFKMYSVYAYGFKKSLDILEELHGDNPEFAKLLDNQESRPEVQAKLSSLLITPIQRIPRYCLLLRQVLDNTLPGEPDYVKLKESVAASEEAARHINSLVEDQENSQRILELSRCVKNGKNLIIKPGRRLIKEGLLNQQTGRHLEIVYFVLMSDIIMVCKIRKAHPKLRNGLKCAHIYPLGKCKITVNKNTKMFEVRCEDEGLVLYPDKGTESDDWIRSLNSAVDKYVEDRRTLRKRSSSRRPASNNNFDTYSDYGLSPGVSRVRKRRWTEENDHQVANGEVSHVDQSDNNSISFGPMHLIKRKKIHTERSSSVPRDRKDSLFPLRQHLGYMPPPVENRIVPYQPGVFRFGAETVARRGFSFKLGNIITGIGNSIKKVFGFK